MQDLISVLHVFSLEKSTKTSSKRRIDEIRTTTQYISNIALLELGKITEDEFAVKQALLEAGPPIDIVLFGTIEGDALDQTAIAVGATFSIGTFDRLQAREDIENTPWYMVKELANQAVSVLDTLHYADGRQAGIVELAAQFTAAKRLQFVVLIRDTGQQVDLMQSRLNGAELYRFMARGNGKIHVWTGAGAGMNGAYPGLNLEQPDASTRYLPGDDAYATIIPATARGIIAVGSYDNLTSMLLPSNQGVLSPFSSRGPSVDGRLKPDIVAPGHGVFSALSRQAHSLWAVSAMVDQFFVGTEFENTFLSPDQQHVNQSGTSMATPVVSGSVALYLQQHHTTLRKCYPNPAVRILQFLANPTTT